MTAIPKPSKSKKTDDIRPRLDEFTQEEIAEKLREAHESRKPVLLFAWKHEPIKGEVIDLDGQTQRIHIQRGYDHTIKIPFKDILKVDDPGE
ncbi:YolD-like family protein [Paenibacillus sp.]|uniref:YolD-like family protein n=1 Tax=Paenibacillus sp. TaxID=58172 RepID=UPI0028B12B6D|nr:YolD-like family protein [Paenibacillus sp.]